jgi:hypothetical protein
MQSGNRDKVLIADNLVLGNVAGLQSIWLGPSIGI